MNSRSRPQRQVPARYQPPAPPRIPSDYRNPSPPPLPTQDQSRGGQQPSTYYQPPAPPQRCYTPGQPPVHHQVPTTPRPPAHHWSPARLQHPSNARPYYYDSYNRPQAGPGFQNTAGNESSIYRGRHVENWRTQSSPYENPQTRPSSYEHPPARPSPYENRSTRPGNPPSRPSPYESPYENRSTRPSKYEYAPARPSSYGYPPTRPVPYGNRSIRSSPYENPSNMGAFDPHQSYEGHKQPSGSYQAQGQYPSHTYQPQGGSPQRNFVQQSNSAGANFNACNAKNTGHRVSEQAGLLPVQTFPSVEPEDLIPYDPPYDPNDLLQNLDEYDSNFTFPTSGDDYIWEPDESVLSEFLKGFENSGSGNVRKSQKQKFNHLFSDDSIKEDRKPSVSNDDSRSEGSQRNTNAGMEETRLRRRKRFAAASNEKGANNGSSKKNIRFHADGSMEWCDGGNWRKAVYHNNIRAELIAQTQNLGQYVHPRAHGHHPLDITSFHPDQASWGPKRSHWAAMPHKLLFRLECNGFPVPNYTVKNMMHNGQVVLDSDGFPVRDFHDIPKTLASNADAYLLENISRLDARISQTDFRARMPTTRETKRSTRLLGGLSFIGQRLRRFRVKNAIIPWKGRENSDKFKEYVKGLLSEEALRNNSTEELGCLSKLQEEEIFTLLRGQHPSRAGSHALTPEERQKRAEKHEQRIQRWRDEEARRSVNSPPENQGQNRKRDDDEFLNLEGVAAWNQTQPPPPESQGQKREREDGGSLDLEGGAVWNDTQPPLPENQGQKREADDDESFDMEIFAACSDMPPENKGQKRKRADSESLALEGLAAWNDTQPTSVQQPLPDLQQTSILGSLGAQNDEPPRKRQNVEGFPATSLNGGEGLLLQSPFQSHDFSISGNSFPPDPTLFGDQYFYGSEFVGASEANAGAHGQSSIAGASRVESPSDLYQCKQEF